MIWPKEMKSIVSFISITVRINLGGIPKHAQVEHYFYSTRIWCIDHHYIDGKVQKWCLDVRNVRLFRLIVFQNSIISSLYRTDSKEKWKRKWFPLWVSSWNRASTKACERIFWTSREMYFTLTIVLCTELTFLLLFLRKKVIIIICKLHFKSIKFTE